MKRLGMLALANLKYERKRTSRLVYDQSTNTGRVVKRLRHSTEFSIDVVPSHRTAESLVVNSVLSMMPSQTPIMTSGDFISTGHEKAQLLISWLETLVLKKFQPGGLHNNKRVVRKTISALYTYDNQILGKMLAEAVFAKYGIDLDAERRTVQWFEQQVS